MFGTVTENTEFWPIGPNLNQTRLVQADKARNWETDVYSKIIHIYPYLIKSRVRSASSAQKTCKNHRMGPFCSIELLQIGPSAAADWQLPGLSGQVISRARFCTKHSGTMVSEARLFVTKNQ
jgi:hypothetical protein